MVWIEILKLLWFQHTEEVTTDAVVWIEIIKLSIGIAFEPVTTDAVVWIEIPGQGNPGPDRRGHH